MKPANILYRLTLPFCIFLGGFMLIALVVWLIPIVGDFIHSLNEDDKWIHLAVVLFAGFVALAYHHLNQRKKDHNLLGTYDEKL